MQVVLEEAIRQMEQGQPCVLATVVRTRGSTPQKPGARLLVRKDGSAVGTLGGGCVEGDIWFAAKEILRKGGGPQYKDYYLNEDIAARDGLVCGGTMYFFLEPLLDEVFLPFGREILKAYQGGDPVAMATVIKAVPGAHNLGYHLLLRSDGTTMGSLGTEALDNEAVEAMKAVADLGRNKHLIAQDGTELFVEGFTTPPTLIMMGGGHIGKALVPLAKSLGFRAYVIDDRPQFASVERFPEADGVVVGDFAKSLEQVPINVNTFIVVATRGHRFDDLALEAAARTRARYVGLVGSKRKTILIFEALLKHGIPMERVRQIHAPIGLDIGALTPEEIAVSIMSEIIMDRLGGTGRPMKLDDKMLEKIEQRVREEQWSTAGQSAPSS